MYQNAEHLGAASHRFALEAAQAGEPILAVLPDPSSELVRNAASPSGAEIHFEDMSARGRNPACLLALFEDWIDAHPGRVRVIGEPIWPGRSRPEVVEVLRHEALVNHVLSAAPVSMMCAYDAGRLEADALEGAELTHPQLLTNGTPRPSRRYGDPLELLAATRWPQDPGKEPISELDFGGDLRALRSAVAADPACEGLSDERRADLVFVVNEAATNAIRHGDGSCVTRLWHDGDTVVSEVQTTGSIADALVGRRRPEVSGAGGRGLWLINQVCDLVELRTGEGGTSLRMHLREAA